MEFISISLVLVFTVLGLSTSYAEENRSVGSVKHASFAADVVCYNSHGAEIPSPFEHYSDVAVKMLPDHSFLFVGHGIIGGKVEKAPSHEDNCQGARIEMAKSEESLLLSCASGSVTLQSKNDFQYYFSSNVVINGVGYGGGPWWSIHFTFPCVTWKSTDQVLNFR